MERAMKIYFVSDFMEEHTESLPDWKCRLRENEEYRVADRSKNVGNVRINGTERC